MKTLPPPQTVDAQSLSLLIAKGSKVDSDLSWSKFNELKRENEALQQENAKLQSIIQDVTSVNKRWQRYNNDRRLYVQKLLSTIQELQEQINLISEKTAFQKPGEGGHDTRLEELQRRHCEEVDRLKQEHQEHTTVLELQIKSHKDDWDAETKDRRKAYQEKEGLEDKVAELTREVQFLKNVLHEEKTRKTMLTCAYCRAQLAESHLQQDVSPGASGHASPLQVSRAFVPTTFRTSVHVPYSLSEEDSDMQPYEESCSYMSDEDWIREKETIVVDDATGMRLCVTEQKPKSILKKDSLTGNLSSRQQRCEADTKRNIICEESAASCALSVGFESNGLARVTAFSSEPSRSEPNTRSNSSENLKPLKASSSWEDCGQGTNTSQDIACPSCDKVFPPTMHLQFLDHFEFCQTTCLVDRPFNF